VDLSRTIIRAPVDGVVIKRSIEPGQTVAVSLAAPELFLIAQNLRDMQVEVSVDEAEVSRLRVGQKATFTVDAFPGRTFEGSVTQVRKAALNVQNVITYTALVSALNESQTLLPGMTANVRVITDVRENVLKVPNAALRFKPPGWVEPPKGEAGKTSIRMPAAVQVAFETLVPSAQAQGQGGGLQAYRERLERELSLTDAQKASVDAIFAGMRDRFAALRDMEPEERRTASEKLRREMRGQVEKLLDPTQKKTFLAINAEIDARRAAAQAGSTGGASSAGASGAAAASAGAAAATASASSTGAAKTSPPAAGSPPAAAPPDGASAKPPSPSSGQASGSGNTQSGTQGGGQLRAFRERLERDLAFTESQRTQLDAIFSSMREQFAAVRDAPEAERPKLMERNRAEMRARINDILDEGQKKKYAEILVELAGRNVSRGRVFIAGPDGKPMALDLRLGLSDGVTTEVIATLGERKLQEGDEVYVGVVGAASKPGPAPPNPGPRPVGPRL
jgi:hypothetical protein